MKSPAAQGGRAYRLRLQEGDDSFGERCELGMANTGSSDIDRVGGSRVLFQNGTESWISQQIMLDPDVYAFCGTECALDYDGGLVQQLKQTGSCGTPANGIVARDLPRVGVVLEHRNSAENDCGNATMKTLWRVPIRRGAWVRILQHVRWSTDRDTGYIATWINGRPVQPSRDGAKKRVTRTGRRGPHPYLDAEGRPRRRSSAPMQVPSVRAPAKRHVPQPNRARRQRRVRGRHHRCKDARGG